LKNTLRQQEINALPIEEATVSRITKSLNDFIDIQMKKRIPTINIEKELQKQPFHAGLFPSILSTMAYYSMISSKIRRDIGNVFEEIAYLLLKDRLGDANVNKQYLLSGKISAQCKNAIEQIANDLFNQGKTHRKPNLKEELSSIAAFLDKQFDIEEISVRVDIMANVFKNERPLYLEMKSYTNALNKNAASAIKRDFLLIHALDFDRRPLVVVGFAYGTTESFNNHFPNRCFFDFEEECLVGKQLWDTLGGDGTYETLLGVFDEVGQLRKDDLDQIISAHLKNLQKTSQRTLV